LDFNHKIKNLLIIQNNQYWSHKIIYISIFIYIIIIISFTKDGEKQLMVDCKFCENQNISFTCEKCNSSFCINHIATTESWLCKKHEINYSKASAAEKFYKCTIIENSKCPECDSLLKLERLSSGQYYLECSDETCSWNSYSKSPGLFFPTKEQLAREEASKKSEEESESKSPIDYLEL